MKKTAILFIVLAITMVISVSLLSNVRIAKADGEYAIENVFHTVTIMYNGHVFINDTVTLNITGQAPNDFLIGFPSEYSDSVLKCIAFSGSDTLPVTLNVPVDNRIGFYFARVDFEGQRVQVFTVGFVLSNSLLSQDPQNVTLFELNFPAYPTLVKEAGFCNVSVAVPAGALYSGGTVGSFTFEQENLQELTHSPATVDFLLTEEAVTKVDIAMLERDISVNDFGEIQGVDTYRITNMAPADLTAFQVFLPPNASNPEATDQLGRPMVDSILTDTNTNRYEVDFNLNVSSGQFNKFSVQYSLPSNYLRRNASDFALKIPLFEHENYYVDQTSITIVLPEGAKIKTFESDLAGSSFSIAKSVYLETATLRQEDLLILANASLGVSYDYNPVWVAFRPTMWMWTAAIIGCAVVAVARRKPTGPTRGALPTTGMKLGPEYFRSFVDTYEEKKKIDSELESLETRVEKGKIPRRRYKVMRKTLEARLGAVSRRLPEYKERMRTAGGQYSALMLQLEVAEAETNEVRANIKNAEILHHRGELSLEAYRNRLGDYQRKKEKAENAINGILLRLREEAR